MLGNISDEKANELLYLVSENVQRNFVGRSVVETPLFPVSHYIHVACRILYDQHYQYKISQDVAKVLPPEKLAKRGKTLATPLNQLAFNSYVMLYLHGRAQFIHERLEQKKQGNTAIEVESEEEKKELKYILDFWQRLSPNYRNDGALTAEDGTIQILPSDFISQLHQEMISFREQPGLAKKLKRTIALLTSRSFLSYAECRAGIFEHGPYQISSDEVLIFKEFITLYTGEKLPFTIDLPMVADQQTTAKSPVPNVIFGMTLKNMEKIQFNDWGTLTSEPSDFTRNITSVGIWTREVLHPKDLRYPDTLGTITKLPPAVLDDLMDYAQKALNELYIRFAKWDFMQKMMAGVNLYVNGVPVAMALHAGLENHFDWTWVQDVLEHRDRSDMVRTSDVLQYIEELGKYPQGVHPFLARFFRSKKKRKLEPSYYALQD
ncbi:MAG: hypothetical protein ACTSRC_19840 [Candidatus Helarchaeota archaeon]